MGKKIIFLGHWTKALASMSQHQIVKTDFGWARNILSPITNTGNLFLN